MVNSSNLVRNGVNVLLNRAFKTVPDYTVPSRFEVSIDTPDVAFTDTSLTNLIPISGTESVDDCSVTTGWTASTDSSVSVNSTTFKPDSGTDGALNFIKSGTTQSSINVYKTVTTLNGTSKDLLVWIYIKDITALNKLTNSGTALEIRYGSSNVNYYSKTYTLSSLTTGWQFFKLAIPSDFSTVGSPTIGSLSYFYLALTFTGTSQTYAAGDFIFDAIRLASADDYYKNIDSVSLDETDASSSIVSTLSVSEANGFLLNGHAILNTDSPNKLIEKSKYPNNSKDVSDLFRFTTKVKLRNIS